MWNDHDSSPGIGLLVFDALAVLLGALVTLALLYPIVETLVRAPIR